MTSSWQALWDHTAGDLAKPSPVSRAQEPGDDKSPLSLAASLHSNKLIPRLEAVLCISVSLNDFVVLLKSRSSVYFSGGHTSITHMIESEVCFPSDLHSRDCSAYKTHFLWKFMFYLFFLLCVLSLLEVVRFYQLDFLILCILYWFNQRQLKSSKTIHNPGKWILSENL